MTIEMKVVACEHCGGSISPKGGTCGFCGQYNVPVEKDTKQKANKENISRLKLVVRITDPKTDHLFSEQEFNFPDGGTRKQAVDYSTAPVAEEIGILSAFVSYETGTDDFTVEPHFRHVIKFINDEVVLSVLPKVGEYDRHELGRFRDPMLLIELIVK